MNCNTPGLLVHHQLLEFTQTHVHRVGDAIQPSRLSPSPPAFNLSQHRGLSQGVSSSHQVAKGLQFQLQHQSRLFQTPQPPAVSQTSREAGCISTHRVGADARRWPGRWSVAAVNGLSANSQDDGGRRGVHGPQGRAVRGGGFREGRTRPGR